MFNITNRLNEFAADWAFVVGHMAWQAMLVAAILLLVVRWGRNWTSPARHGLLLLALVKFLIPPVTDLPIGLFSFWNVGMLAEKNQTEQIPPPSSSTRSHTTANGAQGLLVDHPIEASKLSTAGTITVESNESNSANTRDSNDNGMSSSIQPATDLPAESVPSEFTDSVYAINSNGASHVSLTLLSWLMLVHAGGAVAIGACLLWKARTLRKDVGSMPTAPQAVEWVFRDMAGRIGYQRSVELKISSEDCSPFSMGCFHPVVVVSDRQLNSLPSEQLRAVLLHELVHHYRRDLIVCWWQALVMTCWWFHPVVWMINREIRAMREDCCDDFLLSRKCVEPDIYCETLLNVAKGFGTRSVSVLAMTVSMAYAAHPLSVRFRRIMNGQQIRGTRISIAGIIGILLMAIVLIPGMSNADPPAEESPANVVASEVPADSRQAIANEIPKSSMAVWPDSIRVSVFDPAGEPVAGATIAHKVNKDTLEYTTATDGQVIVPMPADTAAVKFMSLTVDAVTYLVFAKYWYPQRWPDRPIESAYEFRLEAGKSIGGRVTDVENQPVVGANVHVTGAPDHGNRKEPRPAEYKFLAKTNEDGRWVQDRIPAKLESLRMQVRHSEYRSDPNEVWIREDSWASLFDRQFHTVLSTGTLLTGRVTDSNGNPIEGVKLLLGADLQVAHADVPITDGLGQFRFPHCEKGRQPVTAWKVGLAPAEQEVIIKDKPVHIELQMSLGEIVKFRVVDPEGKPIPGAFVSADTWRQRRTLGFSRVHFDFEFPETDADGMWVWPWAPADSINYRIYKTGWQSARLPELSPSDEIRVITLRPERMLTGSVVDIETGIAVPEFGFTLGNDYSISRLNRTKGKDGKFRIAIDESETMHTRLKIEANGYEPVSMRIPKRSTDPLHLKIELRRSTNTRFVTVENQIGEPEANARLIISTGDSRAYIRENLRTDTDRGITLTTDNDGRAELPALGEVFEIYAFSKTGFAMTEAITENRLQAGDITMTTTPTTRIEGVLKKNDQPVPRESVSLGFGKNFDNVSAHFHFDARTDIDGRFVFKQVPAGMDISVVHSLVERDGNMFMHQSGATALLTTESGKLMQLELGRIGKYSVRGKFAYDDGKETIADWEEFQAHLWLSDHGKGRPKSAIQYLPTGMIEVNADGSFEVTGLDEGRYDIFVSGRIRPKRISSKTSLANGSASKSFTLLSNSTQDVIDLGTITIGPFRQSRYRATSWFMPPARNLVELPTVRDHRRIMDHFR